MRSPDKLFELAKSLQLFNLANNSEELIKKALFAKDGVSEDDNYSLIEREKKKENC